MKIREIYKHLISEKIISKMEIKKIQKLFQISTIAKKIQKKIAT